VAFWWVNHKKSWKAETGRGILWAPLATANGRTYQPYLNMALARAGDIVFSYAGSQIAHAGIVDSEAFGSPKPDYASTTTSWADNGLLLPVTFSKLPNPIVPKRHLERIAPLLAYKYAPIQTNGKGNLSYLSAISDDLGFLLLQLGSVTLELLKGNLLHDHVNEDMEDVSSDPSLSPTDKLQLSKARIGQGRFRKSVLAAEPECRVTGVSTVALLKASHIKPWRESTNAERLDGSNGLMLAPHIDHLFDQFLLSFMDDGGLLLSTLLEEDVREKWNLSSPVRPRPFSRRQINYLVTHRERLL
jgi:hypothetical protein